VTRSASPVLVLTARGFTIRPEDPRAILAPTDIAALVPFRTDMGNDPVNGRSNDDAPPPAVLSPAVVPLAAPLVVATPRAFVITPEGARTATPKGEDVTLHLADLLALDACRTPLPIADALAAIGNDVGASAAGIERLVGLGLLTALDERGSARHHDEGSTQATVRRDFERRKQLLRAEADRRVKRGAAPDSRISVIPVYEPVTPPNLALGLILAAARSYRDGALNLQYDFEPSWVVRPKGLTRQLVRNGPAVLLFSNYVWSHHQNLLVSEAAKTASPESICIHGGPDTPKYPDDAAAYFAAHPHVDIAVRNEGEYAVAEILTALDGQLIGRNGDLSCLAEIPGITFRNGGSIVTTADRDRLTDLDVLPSPYLDGTFTDFEGASLEFVIIETNRGCPYGCTFCDWGSATLSRIRQFDLQRVFDELEWAAKHRVESVWLADANFGIFARDVEIAERMVALKAEHGFPKSFVACWAKNTTKHIERIITLFTEADIPFACTLALQSTDASVLEAVHRKNIKTEAYDRLAVALRNAGATVASDIMLGLPGSSLRTFANDLQGCVDREIFVTIYLTALLVNSPMNAPDYREEHALDSELHEVAPGQHRRIVVGSATFTRDDHAVMLRWRRMFRVFENASLLRFVARWVRHSTGKREIDFYTDLEARAIANPARLPVTHWLLTTMTELCEPGSWHTFYDEVRAHVVELLEQQHSQEPNNLPRRELASSLAELDTVLAVQAAFAPRWGRPHSLVLDLPHDYAAWYLDIRRAQERGERWEDTVAPLGTYPPAPLVVDDTAGANANLLGSDMVLDYVSAAEFDAPMRRGRVGTAIPRALLA